MQISKRTEDIIRVLIRYPQDQPVTIATISEEANTSARSVQRELPIVEEWLTKNGYKLVRKRSVGLFLDESEERREQLLALLSSKEDKIQIYTSKENRQYAITHDLLFSDEPIKSYAFTDRYGISEGTLSNELDSIATSLVKYRLALIRRPGLGIFIEGTEAAKRQAIVSFLYNSVTRNRSKGKDFRTSIRTLALVSDELDSNIADDILDILDDTEQLLNLKIADSAYLHMLYYLTYTIPRILSNHILEERQADDSNLTMIPEYAVAEYIMKHVHTRFNTPLVPSETNFFAIYLTGFRIWPESVVDLTNQHDFDIHQITLSLIKNVSKVLGIDLSKDARLPDELSAHVKPMIGRLRAKIPIENPLLDDFQTRYPDIYQACEIGSSMTAEDFGLPQFPASEIGFITIYFVMSLDRKQYTEKKIRVVLVCPTGIGTSRLLASGLKREYPSLDITGNMSAFDLDPEALSKKGIDLIISTIKLDIDYRWIMISPSLTKQDKMLLDSKLKSIEKHRSTITTTERFIPETSFSKEDVEYITALGNEIYTLLDNMKFGKAPVVTNREEIIRNSATLIAETPELEEEYYRVMTDRDRLADTYMKPFRALLLHGKSDKIDRPYFGYLHLEPPVYENTRIILGAIISIIPEKNIDPLANSIVSEIIGTLLEDPSLLKALRSMDQEYFYAALEQHLLKHYQRCLTSLLSI